MNKNVKRMFFVLAIFTLLVSIGAISAADDTNSTAASDSSVSNSVTVSDTASDTIAAEPATTTSNDNKVNTKTIEKEKTTTTEHVIKEKIENTQTKEKTTTNKTQKNMKTSTKTVEVNNGNSFLELVNEINTNKESDKYLISLKNNITVNSSKVLYIGNKTGNVKEIEIEGNNYNLNMIHTKATYFYNEVKLNNMNLSFNFNYLFISQSYTIKLNNTNITSTKPLQNAGVLIISNSTIDYKIKTNKDQTTIIEDSCIIGENFDLTGDGTVITNYTKPEIIIGNVNITNEHINNNLTIPLTANYTIINCNITAPIKNYGNITIINSSLSNTESSGNSKINALFIDNYGNLTMTGCVMENNTFNVSSYSHSFDILNGAIYNNGVMTIINSTFHNNSIGFSRVDSNMGGALQGIHFGRGTIVVNNATLSIDGSNFTSNYAGESGGAIYSTVGTYSNTTLNVNNSYFADNKAGLQGGAISFFGTGSIENTVFINNSEVLNHNVIDNTGGGAIYSAGENQIITNCTFIENDAICEINGLMFVGSTGGAIRSTTTNLTIEDSKFINNYATTNGNSLTINSGTVKNSYFQNNQTGPSNEVIIGYANIVNNTFTNINNTDYIINIASNQPGNLNEHITENNFTNNKVNIDTINTIQNNITIENNMYKNTTIDDTLTLEIPDKIFENEAITINGTYTINNPQNYDQNILEQNKFQVYINGVLTYTLDEISFNITPTPGNMLIIVQPTISQTRSRNMLTSTKLAVITPENYDNYIIEGELLGIAENSQVSFVGNFTDKGEIYINTANIILNGENATFTNTTFTLDKPNITLENMKIINTNTTYPIKSYANNNTIQNNNITLYNTIGDTAAIYTKASNTLITNNTINVTGPAGNIDWESDSSGICTTQAILAIESENNTITYNNITVNGTTTGESFGTIEGITNSRKVNNSLIAYNNITVTGGYFNYAINQLDRINNSTVTENNILVTGFRYADGIQIGDNATNINITKNNITCICLNDTPVDEAAITYGIITTCQGGEASNNFTITENNLNMTGVVNYGMEIYKTTNTIITNNTITANGQQSMGIGYCHSHNSTFENNKITTNDQNITTINSVTEEIPPQSTGIKIQDSMDLIINNNTITTQDANKKDTTIDSESIVTITNNQLTSSTGYGEDTIRVPTQSTIENNIIETTTTITVPETIITNTPVTLTATIKTADGTPINGGTITFTVENEAISQAEVIDGVATATVTFNEAEDTTIVASYTPESSGLTTSSAEATTSIQEPQTQLNIEDVELTAGETVTLTATVTDQAGNNITGGKVIFKVNGKTVKDTNGKVIYAKVVDGVATVEYIVPDNLSGKDVNITAVYSGSSKYNKESTTITKTIAAQETTLTITPITNDVQTGSTITLKAKIAAGDKAITTGKIVFKINGKTVKDENGKVVYAKVDANGEVSVDYNLGNLKAGSYTIEATFIAPNYDKITSNTTMTVVKA